MFGRDDIIAWARNCLSPGNGDNTIYNGTSITRISLSRIFDNSEECHGPCISICGNLDLYKSNFR
jgi:hypothetical protein